MSVIRDWKRRYLRRMSAANFASDTRSLAGLSEEQKVTRRAQKTEMSQPVYVHRFTLVSTGYAQLPGNFAFSSC